jgi:hypothetical protein
MCLVTRTKKVKTIIIFFIHSCASEWNVLLACLWLDDSSDDHGIAMPTALMDVGHHFDEVPRNIRRNRSTKEEAMPREILHDVVLNLHAQRPKTI